MYLRPHFIGPAANEQANEEWPYISRFMLIEKTDLAKADIALIFGNQHCYRQLADEGARLYKNGYCDKIVVSGGRTDNSGQLEAEVIEHHLLQQNIPAKDIITETLSTNTQENVLYSRDKIYDSYGPRGINSLIAVGNIVAGRRFLMTLAQNWPQVLAMASNVNPFPYPPKKFGLHAETAPIVLKEYAKITAYKEAGYITDISINLINSRVAALAQPLPLLQGPQ